MINAEKGDWLELSDLHNSCSEPKLPHICKCTLEVLDVEVGKYGKMFKVKDNSKDRQGWVSEFSLETFTVKVKR